MRVHRTFVVSAIVLTGFLPLLALRAQPATAQPAQIDWLPLCGKCLKPTIFSRSGIGTAHAVALARVTYAGAKQHCENWTMAPNTDCDKEAKQTVKQENGKIYQASADCVHGKLTDASGNSFTYAGLWPSGFAEGKTRWRWTSGYDAGKIVSVDRGLVNGMAISAIGDVLCPGGFTAKGLDILPALKDGDS